MNLADYLRDQLEKKLKNEWETKWIKFGEYHEDKLNRKSKFYEALAQRITTDSGITISRDTVMRFCNASGGDSQNSLLAFAKYLGYPSLQVIEAELSPQKDKKRPIYTVISSTLLIVLLSTIVWYIWYWIPTKEKLAIEKVIEDANAVQFKIFQSLNLQDSIFLDNFYTAKGSAHKAIITTVKQNILKSRRIDYPKDNPSFYTIFDKQVLTIDSEVATAKTTEHWFLKWYDVKTNRYVVSYDVKNEQFYELKKQDGMWKIDHNFYEGKATKIDY